MHHASPWQTVDSARKTALKFGSSRREPRHHKRRQQCKLEMSDQDQHLERVAEIAINDFEQGGKRKEARGKTLVSFFIFDCQLPIASDFYRDCWGFKIDNRQ